MPKQLRAGLALDLGLQRGPAEAAGGTKYRAGSGNGGGACGCRKHARIGDALGKVLAATGHHEHLRYFEAHHEVCFQVLARDMHRREITCIWHASDNYSIGSRRQCKGSAATSTGSFADLEVMVLS